MKANKLLEMLNSNRIEELKALAQDELYQEALKVKPGAKKRYTAMKKYFSYHSQHRTCLTKPCRVEFEGKDYISFTNSWSLVLTSEDCGEIELFDPEKYGKYPDVTRLLRFDGLKKKIDYAKVIAEAKSKGYRLNKSEVDAGFKYLMLYDDTYYKIGLIDATFGIIDDGNIPTTHHPYGERMPITITNDLGFCMIMPVKYEGIANPEEDGKIVINVD